MSESSARVYVVSTGERGEGTTPLAAYAALDLAKAYVRDSFNVVPHQVNNGRWKATQLNGVDEVWIHRLKVRGAA